MSNHRGHVGRQLSLPLSKAISISVNSLRIRFWRSMVTAGGIFLGIAFLSSVLTQAQMKWPGAQKVGAGYVRVDGQVQAPGDMLISRVHNVNDALSSARGPIAKSADMSNLMIVGKGRKISLDLAKDPASGEIALRSGDYIFVPDINDRYRSIWLAVMSLLVCTVGITNSMLMSVTERFKEIGTMKCLGALDSFIVTLFMLESAMMGVTASFLGWLVGFIAIAVTAGFSRGWDSVAAIGVTNILKTLVVSVITGLVLTILATIAPAKRAADMPAAMALRTEI